MKKRCGWCDENSPEYIAYHDKEWGVPVIDDRILFEMLILEGMQAGLSWLTILKKRDHFRHAFDFFDPAKVANYGTIKLAHLMENPGIIRNKLKLEAAIKNARAVLQMQDEYSSFAVYLWQWVEGIPIQNRFTKLSELPAKTALSERISKDLKKRGMNFVGPTIMYAFMQAVGMVNDHELSCFRYNECRDYAEKVKIITP